MQWPVVGKGPLDQDARPLIQPADAPRLAQNGACEEARSDARYG
jgi:hypothetical protein